MGIDVEAEISMIGGRKDGRPEFCSTSAASCQDDNNNMPSRAESYTYYVVRTGTSSLRHKLLSTTTAHLPVASLLIGGSAKKLAHGQACPH